ncbi:MAG: phosphatidylcholine synthase [Hyphomicrobiales bacterium]|jgi:phosphatidylcholine synthase|nr:phosphatidylcholine synthase [Hyphomicrobiales bacterium]
MAADDEPTPSTPAAFAFAVHIFTACGAALALLALVAAVERDWPLMFGMLGLALIIDGVDGTLARHFRVAERLPRWSGETLDLVVDFVTYVFVPAYAIAAGNLLPPRLAIPGAVVIAVTGALYFADRRMKMADNYFRGFPALWNLAAFYLFLLRPEPWIAVLSVGLLAVATFLPFPFVHPFRVARLRVVTLAMVAAWAILAVVALSRGMMPGLWITAGLCAIGLYFFAAGLLRRAERES